jgi:hypothetical protein
MDKKEKCQSSVALKGTTYQCGLQAGHKQFKHSNLEGTSWTTAGAERIAAERKEMEDAAKEKGERS